MIGKILSPLLEELEDMLWEFEANNGCPPHFTEGGFRASMKIFMAALMERMWINLSLESLPLEKRAEIGEQMGMELRALVMKYTNIDTHTLYDNKFKEDEKV